MVNGMRKLAGLATVVAVMGSCISAWAQQPGGLMRDELALGLNPTTANWGMGGAYVGVPGRQSMNPAALAFVDSNSVSVGGVYWNPNAGANVLGGRIDVVVPFFLNGHARFMGYDYETIDDGAIKPPGLAETEFQSRTLGFQAGIPITDTLAIGLGGYPYETATVDMFDPASGARVEGSARSQIGSVQAGMQWRALDNVTVGLEGIYIIDKMTGRLSGVPAPPRNTDDYHIFYGAAGASWSPCDGTLLAVDYRIGHINGDDFPTGAGTFRADVDRWAFGISQDVGDRVTLRAGSNNGGATLGAGLQITDNVSLDYTFIYEAFRDREDAFGRVKLHALAVTVDF